MTRLLLVDARGNVLGFGTTTRFRCSRRNQIYSIKLIHESTVLFVTTQVCHPSYMDEDDRGQTLLHVWRPSGDHCLFADQIGALIKKRSNSSSNLVDEIRAGIASDSSSEGGSRRKHRRCYHRFLSCIFPHKSGRQGRNLKNIRSGGCKRRVLPQPTPSLNSAWTRTYIIYVQSNARSKIVH